MKLYNSNKKLQFLNLFLGIVWIFIGSTNLVYENYKWDYVQLFIGICYIFNFFYDFKYKNIEINENEIVNHSLPKVRILLSDLTEVKYFAGDYIFKSKNKRIEIVKKNINSKQLAAFELLFDSLKMKVEENFRMNKQ